MATELRRHRDLSETVFGLILAGRVSVEDIDGNLMVYPYNAAMEDMPADAAELSIKYGAEAITSAMYAAERANGIAPEEWLKQLIKVHQDFRIVNTLTKTQKKLGANEDVDWDEVRSVIDQKLSGQEIAPMSWSDANLEFEREWLWTGWIPAGETTILVGQQGAGKSAMALYLADCIANGKPLPDGSYPDHQTGVLWVETEGRQGENIRRAKAWGIESRNIYAPSQDLRRVLNLLEPEDRAIVRAHAMRPEIGLVVIDSLGGSLMEENDAMAKRLLQGLSVMAQETNTTFIIIHHLRKVDKKRRTARIELQDVRGHSGITQFAPSVIAIDYEGGEVPRSVYHLKMNLEAQAPTLVFSISPLGLVFNNDTRNFVERQIAEEALMWLEGLLKDGPMSIVRVLERAAEEDYDLELMKRVISYPTIKIVREGNERCLSL